MKDNVGRKPVCAVKGMLAGGRAVCGRVINAKYCGSVDACEHKVEQMKTLTAIPLSELIKKAGSKRRVAQIAGIQNLGSLSHESVLIGDKAKPLTSEELKSGSWCVDVNEECMNALVEKGLVELYDWSIVEGNKYCSLAGSIVVMTPMMAHNAALKQIHLVGNEFYWGEK